MSFVVLFTQFTSSAVLVIAQLLLSLCYYMSMGFTGNCHTTLWDTGDSPPAVSHWLHMSLLTSLWTSLHPFSKLKTVPGQRRPVKSNQRLALSIFYNMRSNFQGPHPSPQQQYDSIYSQKHPHHHHKTRELIEHSKIHTFKTQDSCPSYMYLISF